MRKNSSHPLRTANLSCLYRLDGNLQCTVMFAEFYHVDTLFIVVIVRV